MISLIWTRSPLPGSKFIRWGTGEPVSHFAIQLDKKLVFHSNFHGAHLKWLSTFLKRNEIVYQLDLAISPEQEELIYQRLINQFDEQPYDWGALAFWFVSLLRHKITGAALPERNLWGSSRGFLCVELAQCLDVLGIDLTKLDITLPERLYFILKEKLNGHISNP